VFDAFDTIGQETYVVDSATGTAAGTTPEVTYAGDSDTDGGAEAGTDDIDTTGEVTCVVPSTTEPNDTTGDVTCDDGTDADTDADTIADGACARVCDDGTASVTAGEVTCVTSAAGIDAVTPGDAKCAIASDGDTTYSLASSSGMGTGTIVDDTCDTASATETAADTT